MQQLYEMSTNFLYSFNEITADSPQVTEADPQVYLLGLRFQLDKTHSKRFVNEQISRFLSNVAWFHYRKHFYPIVQQETLKEITTDGGWGCMIRAGQMMLFVALLKHSHPEKFQLKSPFDGNCLKILRLNFFEGMSAQGLQKLAKSGQGGIPGSRPATDLGTFALQNFVRQAKTHYQLQEGSWFRPTTFLLGLKRLVKPRKDLKRFRVFNCFENIIYFESLCKKAFDSFELDSLKSWQEAVELLLQRDWDNQVLMSICTMLGIESMDPRYKLFLKGLLDVDSFVGMIGGHNQRAYYFLGYRGDLEFLYLDPHYVKRALPSLDDDATVRQQYFSKTFMTISYAKLSSSVCVSYLLKGKQDFARLWKALQELEALYKDDFFLAYFLGKKETELGDDDIIILD